MSRRADVLLRTQDEHAVFTVAAYHPEYKVTLSLLSVLGRDGVAQMDPRMTEVERAAPEVRAQTLQRAAETIR